MSTSSPASGYPDHTSTISTASTSHTPIVSSDVGNDQVSQPDQTICQDISGKNISPFKLVALLRTKFGAGAYDLKMTRNVYNIRAPRRLSLNEILACR